MTNVNYLAVDEGKQEPMDLMSIPELCLKHGYDYNYLYKWSIIKGVIPVYYRGTWKLSESEVQEFSRTQKEQKLAKIRRRVGNN